MSTPVIQIINMFAEQNISAIPIVDENNVVVNVYETIDVMVSRAVIDTCSYVTFFLLVRALLYQENIKN